MPPPAHAAALAATATATAVVRTKKAVKLNNAAAALQKRLNNAANLPSADLLEELAARFVLNCPEEELNSFERILFLVEQAHWYYEDFVREEQRNLKGTGRSLPVSSLVLISFIRSLVRSLSRRKRGIRD